jgi:hypothetical protein
LEERGISTSWGSLKVFRRSWTLKGWQDSEKRAKKEKNCKQRYASEVLKTVHWSLNATEILYWITEKIISLYSPEGNRSHPKEEGQKGTKATFL